MSSCLGDSRERAEVLDADHREMCRYASAQDPSYHKVAAELHTVYSTVLANPRVAVEAPKEATVYGPPSVAKFSVNRDDQGIESHTQNGLPSPVLETKTKLVSVSI